MSNAAVDWATLSKVIKKQSANSIRLNPFLRRRDSRFGDFAVNPQTSKSLPATLLTEPVYPMLRHEWVEGVQLALKNMRKHPLFQQALMQLLDLTAFTKARPAPIHRDKDEAKKAAKIMRCMELMALVSEPKFADTVKSATSFLHPPKQIPRPQPEVETKVAEVERFESVPALSDKGYKAEVNSMYTQWAKVVIDKQVLPHMDVFFVHFCHFLLIVWGFFLFFGQRLVGESAPRQMARHVRAVCSSPSRLLGSIL